MSDLARNIKMESCPVLGSISCWLCSVSACNLVHYFKYFLFCSLKTVRCHFMLSINDHYYTYAGNNEPEKRRLQKQYQQQKQQQYFELPNHENHDTDDEIITYEDIDTVVSSLGIDGWQTAWNQDNSLIQEAHKFLDRKNASLEELKEAFHVFDRNEDGFITAFELWSVLRRLGLKEGRRYEDCEEMIRVYDKDGDGRISFTEFKHMVEQAF